MSNLSLISIEGLSTSEQVESAIELNLSRWTAASGLDRDVFLDDHFSTARDSADACAKKINEFYTLYGFDLPGDLASFYYFKFQKKHGINQR